MPTADFIFTTPGLVFFKLEPAGTYGTDSLPVPGTDAVFVRSIDVQPNMNEIDIQRMRDTFANTGKAIGKCWYNISAELPVAGAPDPGVADLPAPEANAFLECAGLKGTGTDEGSGNIDRWTYNQNSKVEQPSGTLYYFSFQNGGTPELIIATGCIFSWTKEHTSGGEAIWKLEGKGLYSVPTNPAAPTTPTFQSSTDETVDRGATITINGRTDCVDNVTINSGGTVNEVTCQGEEFGVAGFIRDHDTPSIDVDPTKVLTSTADIDTEIVDQTLFATSIVHTSVRGTLWNMTSPNTQRGAIQYDRGGNVVRVPCKLFPIDTDAGAGDDSLSFYTERA